MKSPLDKFDKYLIDDSPWYILVDEENINILAEWRYKVHDWKQPLKVGILVDNNGLRYSNLNDYKKSWISCDNKITTEDFRREILKEKMPSITEDYLYLIDLFKKLKIKWVISYLKIGI